MMTNVTQTTVPAPTLLVLHQRLLHLLLPLEVRPGEGLHGGQQPHLGHPPGQRDRLLAVILLHDWEILCHFFRRLCCQLTMANCLCSVNHYFQNIFTCLTTCFDWIPLIEWFTYYPDQLLFQSWNIFLIILVDPQSVVDLTLLHSWLWRETMREVHCTTHQHWSTGSDQILVSHSNSTVFSVSSSSMHRDQWPGSCSTGGRRCQQSL